MAFVFLKQFEANLFPVEWSKKHMVATLVHFPVHQHSLNFYSFFFFSFLSIRFSQISYDTIRQDNSSIGSVILDHEYNLVSNMLRKSISWIAFVFCYALSCMDSSSTDLLLHFSFIEVHIFNHPNHLTSCSVVNL